MSEGKEGPCGTAQLLEDILRACFGTILVEPIKWRIVSTATPYRSMLRNAIKSGKAAFNERTVEALCALVNAGLRIGEDSSTYDPDLVAKGITELLKKRGWGDFGELAQQSGDTRLTQERRKALAAMIKEVAGQLHGKASISEGDEARIKEALQRIALAAPQRVREEEAAGINLLATEALPASMDLLMRQIHLPDGDEFLSAADEQGSWIALSEIYCSGVKVDSIIRAALDRGITSRYGAQSEAALTYYMAKFDLKRGDVKQSDKDLWQLRRTLEDNRSKIDGACADRMSALASIRQLTNNAEPSAGHAAQFESAVGAPGPQLRRRRLQGIRDRVCDRRRGHQRPGEGRGRRRPRHRQLQQARQTARDDRQGAPRATGKPSRRRRLAQMVHGALAPREGADGKPKPADAAKDRLQRPLGGKKEEEFALPRPVRRGDCHLRHVRGKRGAVPQPGLHLREAEEGL